MPRLLLFVLIAGVVSMSVTSAVFGQSPAEAKLREQLRATMLQLRTAESERATLQAAQATNEEKIKESTAQVETLRKRVETLDKQVVSDKEAADKEIASLSAQMASKEAQLGQFKEAVEKWRAAQDKAVALARTKEGDRAKLAAEVIVLKRQIADQQSRNLAMFKLGNEILNRYEGFGLGTALARREPFIGTTRVKFQNLIQDYGDQLDDQRIRPAEARASAERPPEPASKSEKPPADKPPAAPQKTSNQKTKQ